jgi:hypothetical protein
VADFRRSYLNHRQIMELTGGWAQKWPAVVKRHTIGKSPEGREVIVLEIGLNGDKVRPAVWIDGNMHATELAGSSTALALAEDFIHLFTGTSAGRAAFDCLASSELEVLRQLTVYVCPRISPDGAEAALSSGRYTRSSPDDRRVARSQPRWRVKDMDGDGTAGYMRIKDPCGELVESSKVSGLLVPRRSGDEGPFFKLWPEGDIENFDGAHIPDPTMLSDNSVDFNRNFPWNWRPEPEQYGAGDYPGSAPETRAVIEFVTGRPNIFAWLNFHTYGGVFIRPLGHLPDHKMNQNDLAIFRQIAAWNSHYTGYPTVSGFEDFLYEPDKPLHGDLTEYAFHQRGAIALVCEIWDIFNRIGCKSGKKFIDYYFQIDREEIESLALWDKEHNHGRIVGTWRAFEHPQLGPVELGGYNPLIGVSNPPESFLPGICNDQARAFLKLAAMAPRIDLSAEVSRVGDVCTLTVTTRNLGYLSTTVMESFKDLPINEPLVLRWDAEDGVEVLSPGGNQIEIGHLLGWGRGLHAQLSGLAMPVTTGSSSSRVTRLVVRGQGVLHLRVGNCRVGWHELRATV